MKYFLLQVITTILDESSLFRNGKFSAYRREILCLIVVLVGFLGGLLLVTNGGVYWVQAIDSYCGVFGLFVIAIGLVVAVIQIIGSNNLSMKLYMMTGRHIPRFIKYFSWPLSIIILSIGVTSEFVLLIKNGIPSTICSGEDSGGCSPGIEAVIWLIALTAPVFVILFSFGNYLRPKLQLSQDKEASLVRT